MKNATNSTFKEARALPVLRSPIDHRLLRRFMKTPNTAESLAEAANGKSQDRRELMTNHPFFKEFRRDHIAALADCAMKTEFAPGDLIFREVDPANRFFLIL